MNEEQIRQEIKRIKQLVIEDRFKKAFDELGSIIEEIDRLDKKDNDDKELQTNLLMIQRRFNSYNKDTIKGIQSDKAQLSQISLAILEFLNDVEKIAIEYTKEEDEASGSNENIYEETIETLAPNALVQNTPTVVDANPPPDLIITSDKIQVRDPKPYLIFLAFVIVCVIGVWYLNKIDSNNPIIAGVSSDVPSDVPPTGDDKNNDESNAKTLEPFGKNGIELGLRAGSAEYFLADYLSNPESVFPSKHFSLEKVNFSNNSARLNPDARKQLDSIIIVLKEYPTARIEINGYVLEGESGTGNKEKSLDGDRAKAVRKYLKSENISEDRMNFWGGSEGEKANASIKIKSRE